MKIICVSDLHLGSDVCNEEALLKFFSELECDILILNGDVLDNCDVRLNKRAWKILTKIRKLAENIKVVWVKGNHDWDADHIAHMIGAEFVDQYIVNKCLFFHGDEFDEFITKKKRLTYLADKSYRFIQKINKKFAVYLKYKSKMFLRNSEKVKQGALEKMKKLDCGLVCCGHTHYNISDLPYFNTGSWADEDNFYLLIENGKAKLCQFL